MDQALQNVQAEANARTGVFQDAKGEMWTVERHRDITLYRLTRRSDNLSKTAKREDLHAMIERGILVRQPSSREAKRQARKADREVTPQDQIDAYRVAVDSLATSVDRP